MAGDDDRNRVLAVGGTYRSGSFGIADAAGEFLVRNRLAVWNLLQLPPDFALERRSLWRERQVELSAAAREVLMELFHGVGERSARRGLDPAGVNLVMVRELEFEDRAVVRGEQQASGGSFGETIPHARYATMEGNMALAFLLVVLFFVVLLIAFFIFPPTKWVRWFYNQEGGQDDHIQK